MEHTARAGQSSAPPRLFYGWVVVAATFVVLMMGFGIAYSFAAFFVSLRDEFGATRGEVSLVFAITGFLYFALGAVSGPIADRAGPRRVVAFGVALIVIGLLLASRAQTLWQIYLTYSLGVGVGVGFAYVPAIGTIQRWFVRRRGFASGLAVAGIGVGNLAGPPLAALLIRATDWRATYVMLALATLLAGGAAALLLEHSPQRRGLAPDGVQLAGDEPATRPVDAPATASHPATLAPMPPVSLTTRDALRSRPYWLLYAATVATSLGLFIPFAHLAPYARDHGLSDVSGPWLVGLIGAGSAAGRLGLGGVADRAGRRPSLIVAFVGMAVMLLWWLGSSSFWALAVFAVLFGVGYGGFVALVPALTIDYFGPRSAGAIIGLLYTGAGFGALIGPYFAGRVYDLRESYTLPIIIAVLANLLAAGCMLALAAPARWRAARSAAAFAIRAGDELPHRS